MSTSECACMNMAHQRSINLSQSKCPLWPGPEPSAPSVAVTYYSKNTRTGRKLAASAANNTSPTDTGPHNFKHMPAV